MNIYIFNCMINYHIGIAICICLIKSIIISIPETDIDNIKNKWLQSNLIGSDYYFRISHAEKPISLCEIDIINNILGIQRYTLRHCKTKCKTKKLTYRSASRIWKSKCHGSSLLNFNGMYKYYIKEMYKKKCKKSFKN